MMLRPVLFGLAFAAAAGVAGCDSRPPPLVAVRGRVALLDMPLRSGVVVFTPDADRGTYGAPAVGTIGPDGQFVLMTDGAPGAMPGWHRVTVACLDTLGGYRVPDRYQDPLLSGVRAEVRPGTENVVSLRIDAQ